MGSHKGKNYQSNKKKGYYAAQFIRTERNKINARKRIYRRKLEIPHNLDAQAS